MSQPPLTRLVAEVERAIGATLFARTTRRVSLTPVGEVFVAEARAVLARAVEARRVVREAAQWQAGQLRLAYTPLALMTVLPHILAAFREQEHDARVDLVELPGTQVQREALTAGQVDVAFVDEPFPADRYKNLLLHREPLSLIVPKEHPLAAHASIHLRDIGGEPLILHPQHEYPAYYDRIVAACEAAGIIPNILQRGVGQNCMVLVLGGAGLLLTTISPGDFQAPGLRCVGVETPLPLLAEVWAVWLAETVPVRAEALIKIIQNQVPLNRK